MKFDKHLLNKLSFKITKADFGRYKKGIFCNALDIVLIYVFEDASIDHNERLIRLKEIKSLAKKECIPSAHAYALGLLSAVLRELGQNNTSIKIAQKAIKIFKQVDDQLFANSGLIFCYTILGKSYNQIGLQKIGLDQLEKAMKILRQINQPGLPSFRINEGIAECYSELGDQKKTFHYLDICLETIENHINRPENILATKIPILFKIAIEHRKLGDYKQCLMYLKQAESAMDLHKDDVIYEEQFQRELCTTYLRMGKLSKARTHLDKAILLSQKQKNNYKTLEGKYLLGELMIKQGELEEALPIFLSILENSNAQENKHLLAKVNQSLASIYYESNDLVKMAHHFNIYGELLKQNYLEKHKIMAKNKEEAIDRMMVELDIVRKEKENQMLKMELDHKNRQLASKALLSASNRNFLESILVKLETMTQTDSTIIHLFRDRINETQDWEEFEKRFNEVHPNFIKKLDINKPSLTPTEIRVASLIKMGCDKIEIAHFLWVSNRGVEQHRYRIKKKLGIQQNLTTYLLSI
tara:strand:- start:771 stop:2351 length:1581 start_codon:yes stop_codon:yes gene_type:complete